VFVEQRYREVSSVVGIVKIAPKYEREGVLIHYIAVISLAIAIYNLLPLLPLDGGHLLFGFVEWLRRGRPAPRDVFERMSMVGLALMLSLFFVGLRNVVGLGG
jgi:regulator of sigma E protease